MRISRTLLAGAALVALALAAHAQTAVTLSPASTLSGTEKLKATCNNGSGCDILVNHVRNTAGYLTIPTATTLQTAPNWYTSQLIAIGPITTWNITLPNPAPDGFQFTITNGTGSSFSSNTTVVTGTGPQTQTLNATYSSQTLASFGSAGWQFACTVPASCTTGTWYRIQ
jgi:hypothetical protein